MKVDCEFVLDGDKCEWVRKITLPFVPTDGMFFHLDYNTDGSLVEGAPLFLEVSAVFFSIERDGVSCSVRFTEKAPSGDDAWMIDQGWEKESLGEIK